MERNNCYKCSVMSDSKQVPCPRTLSLRWNASAVLVITRRAECTAWQSTPMRFLSLAMERSDRSNLLTSHTCFFDYFATLVMTKARWPRRLKRLLAMTIHTAFAMTTCLYTCHTRLVIANPVRVKQSTCQRWPRGTRPLAMTSCFSAYGAIYAVIAGVYKHDFDK